MKDSAIASGASILLAVIGLAILAIVLSNRSDSANVFGTFGTQFANAVKCAVSPITGGGCPQNGTSSSTIRYGSSEPVNIPVLGNLNVTLPAPL